MYPCAESCQFDKLLLPLHPPIAKTIMATNTIANGIYCDSRCFSLVLIRLSLLGTFVWENHKRLDVHLESHSRHVFSKPEYNFRVQSVYWYYESSPCVQSPVLFTFSCLGGGSLSYAYREGEQRLVDRIQVELSLHVYARTCRHS